MSTKIINGINKIRQAVAFLLQLHDYLRQQLLEECRYEIYYILKQALVKTNYLKEKLDAQDSLNVDDNIEFAHVDQSQWATFYSSEKANQLRIELGHDKGVIMKQFIDYLNYIQTFTSLNYNQYLQALQPVTTLNLQENFPPELVFPQFHQKMIYFTNVLKTNPPQSDQLNLKITILWLFLAAKYPEVFRGTLVDIDAFQAAYVKQDFPAMKASVKL